MTIRDFFRTIWYGKWYALIALVAVVAGAAYYVSGEESLYEAQATVELASAETAGGETATTVSVQVDPATVRSAPVAEAAATALGREGQAAQLASQVTAELAADDPTQVVITATSTDPTDAVVVANAFATAYVAYLPTLVDEQITQLDARRTALADQLAQVPENELDPLASADRESIIGQYQTLSGQISTMRSIVTPGTVGSPAVTATVLGYGTWTILGVSVLAGLLAGIGLAFARRGLDERIRSTAEAASLARTPVLAEVFDVGSARRVTSQRGVLPVFSRSATPFTESIRELRTAVQVPLGDRSPAVVVVTAAEPDAPRAFIAANLAASWALSGRATVAVSGDLRRPALPALLPPPEDWDEPEEDGEGGLRPTRVPNLRVFTLPEEELDPADYLATTRVLQLLRQVGAEAEVIVIDAPPVLAAADATILGGYGDGAVIVATAGRTHRSVLVEAVDRLRAGNVRIFGLALAGVRGNRRIQYASTYGEPSVPFFTRRRAAQEAAHAAREGAPVADDGGYGAGSGGGQAAAESDDVPSDELEGGYAHDDVTGEVPDDVLGSLFDAEPSDVVDAVAGPRRARR